jgi:hypothetical protein
MGATLFKAFQTVQICIPCLPSLMPSARACLAVNESKIAASRQGSNAFFAKSVSK